MAPEPRSFGLLGRSYKRRSRARARHGRSTSSTGSQSANVDSREGDFGFSPDSGRGPGAALTGSFDPDGRAVGVPVGENEVIDQLAKTLVELDPHTGSCLGVVRIDGNDALQ